MTFSGELCLRGGLAYWPLEGSTVLKTTLQEKKYLLQEPKGRDFVQMAKAWSCFYLGSINLGTFFMQGLLKYQNVSSKKKSCILSVTETHYEICWEFNSGFYQKG